MIRDFTTFYVRNMAKQFSSFREFYPFYLEEHSHPKCRLLHFIGSTLVLAVMVFTIITAQWVYLWLLPLIGYGFAWIGHFVFEKNRPATFQYPLYSLIGDWVMYKDIWLGKISLREVQKSE
ncbi:Mpo1-like protein [Glaciecola sp. 1036]|uniref:Mpo1-like protein n=1 Tax=Alteromonadaceae TaxID=72275 RepID=UPI003CFBFA31